MAAPPSQASAVESDPEARAIAATAVGSDEEVLWAERASWRSGLYVFLNCIVASAMLWLIVAVGLHFSPPAGNADYHPLLWLCALFFALAINEVRREMDKIYAITSLRAAKISARRKRPVLSVRWPHATIKLSRFGVLSFGGENVRGGVIPVEFVIRDPRRVRELALAAQQRALNLADREFISAHSTSTAPKL